MALERDHDPHTGTQTTGHEWDGIKELDTPLPRWWLILFYATIVIAIVMWVLLPSWPGPGGYWRGLLHESTRANVVSDINDLRAHRSKFAEQLMRKTPDEIEKSPELFQFAVAQGAAAFGDNCATCHGPGGRGAKGYPSLADDVWLWGGTLADIEHTIKVGVRNDNPNTRFSQMPSFGRDGILKPAQINDLTEYVLSLSGRPHDGAGAVRGAPLFGANCAVCHGPEGAGNRQFGAPPLNGQHVWLYGGTRQDIHDQIWFGRGGVMPTWEKRLDPTTIRSLTIYVHSLGGGEPTPEGAAPSDTPAAPGAGALAPPAPAPSAQR